MSSQQAIQTASIGLTIRDLQVSYDGKTNVLQGMDLDIAPGEILGLVGASGCGKSTLLRVIAGLQACQSGTVLLSNSDGARNRDKISFVFQDATLLPWRTVYENVALPLELLKSKSGDRLSIDEFQQRIQTALMSVELIEPHWQMFPRQLSGGMKMRASIARALVTDPSLLLLDEPFAALDDLLRTKLNVLLLTLWEARRRTILFVTHNIAEAVWLSHRIAVFGNRKVAQLIDNPLPWPRRLDQRTSLEFAQQYGRVSQALTEVNP